MNPFLPINSVPQSEEDQMIKQPHLIVSDAAASAVLPLARHCSCALPKHLACICSVAKRLVKRFSKRLPMRFIAERGMQNRFSSRDCALGVACTSFILGSGKNFPQPTGRRA
jgi:hypothetical protein